MKTTLQDAVKGMEVKNWEKREYSSGQRVVYVRFVPKKPAVIVNMKEG